MVFGGVLDWSAFVVSGGDEDGGVFFSFDVSDLWVGVFDWTDVEESAVGFSWGCLYALYFRDGVFFGEVFEGTGDVSVGL